MPSTDYLSYLETGSNERTIIKYTGTAASVTIPTSIGGGNVTAIGDSAFKGNGTLTNVSIPETVRTIGDYAFAGCSKLKTVSIPRSLRTIGSWVFSGCGSLSSLTLPDGVTSIGEDLCINCSDLMSVTLPSTLTVIPESMRDRRCGDSLHHRWLDADEGKYLVFSAIREEGRRFVHPEGRRIQGWHASARIIEQPWHGSLQRMFRTDKR